MITAVIVDVIRAPSGQGKPRCGSSPQAAHFAAQGVIAGACDIVIACGVESMSRVPMGRSRAGRNPFEPLAGRYPREAKAASALGLRPLARFHAFAPPDAGHHARAAPGHRNRCRAGHRIAAGGPEHVLSDWIAPVGTGRMHAGSAL